MEDIGKIYKICGYGMNYYGSTTESIKRRLARHKSHYKDYLDNKRTDKITVFDIFDKGDDYNIVLIEHFICPDKKTLLDRENHYITSFECVNKCVPNRTLEQLKDRQKKYNEKNKETIREYKKEWAEKNRREKGIKEKAKGFNENEYHKEYNKIKRANETPEQKEIRLEKRREAYKNNNLNEKQKEYLNNPDIKEKRRLQQIERRKENKDI